MRVWARWWSFMFSEQAQAGRWGAWAATAQQGGAAGVQRGVPGPLARGGVVSRVGPHPVTPRQAWSRGGTWELGGAGGALRSVPKAGRYLSAGLQWAVGTRSPGSSLSHFLFHEGLLSLPQSCGLCQDIISFSNLHFNYQAS